MQSSEEKKRMMHVAIVPTRIFLGGLVNNEWSRFKQKQNFKIRTEGDFTDPKGRNRMMASGMQWDQEYSSNLGGPLSHHLLPLLLTSQLFSLVMKQLLQLPS